MNLWQILWPLLKKQIVVVLVATGAILLAWSGLAFWFHHLLPPWQAAQATFQAAQTELTQAQADQLDFDTHRRTFEQLKASGLMDGDPRPGWAEEVQRLATAYGVLSQLTFILAPPEAIDLPQAQAINAKVTRHPMEIHLASIHEIEALQFITAVVEKHKGVARLANCSFDKRDAATLVMKCRVNFLHIEPNATNPQNPSS
jgi:hypothetical protein